MSKNKESKNKVSVLERIGLIKWVDESETVQIAEGNTALATDYEVLTDHSQIIRYHAF